MVHLLMKTLPATSTSEFPAWVQPSLYSAKGKFWSWLLSATAEAEAIAGPNPIAEPKAVATASDTVTWTVHSWFGTPMGSDWAGVVMEAV
jgi:hypothetical protein